MWAFSAAIGLLMIMYYMVFGDKMKIFLFMGILIIILEMGIFYFLHKRPIKSFFDRKPTRRKTSTQNNPYNHHNTQQINIKKDHKKQHLPKKRITPQRQSKQWTVIDIATHVDMSMQDVILFAKNYSNLNFTDLNFRTEINNDTAFNLMKELKQYKIESTQQKLQQELPKKKRTKKKKKNTITKPISIQELANMLNISASKLIQLAYKSNMPFKKNIKPSTIIHNTQAQGLFNKIKRGNVE